ncbi:hypothetical protein M378DRAFT_184747 [Amanita muscaria Koide BX008]|uniref:Uncharacterized protein n=1 Tax=Amanita muscaria (strain Koide BX008) TaxID=946122 RepID=A0A0C2XHF9_AMAMK|nr:hypothetical protein M378DRAFT_184747 [Amanita muscaria Koide BX008]
MDSSTTREQHGGDLPPEFKKKDGTPSKMRSHRGNIPVLPQTKLCPQCPAKFTRTTHLNRHLRTHTNERLHHCNTCSAQFTRSDLLTRHKKSCNESTSRTRRKSCVSCMESKIKCDRQYPCSKCVSRGKECVFASPITSKPVMVQSTPPTLTHTETFSVYQQPLGTHLGPSVFTATKGAIAYLDRSITGYSSQNHHLEAIHVADALSVDSGRYTPSKFGANDASFDYASYAASEVESTTEVNQLMPPCNRLTSIYSNDMFEPLFSNLFSQNPSSGAAASPEDISWSGDPRSGSPEDFPFATHPLNRAPGDSYGVAILNASPSIQPLVSDIRGLSLDGNIAEEPAELELQHYTLRNFRSVYLFLTSFLAQMPIVHVPTFNQGSVPPVLLNAMRACGALFVRTRRAMQFILDILASAREMLLQEFAKNPEDLQDQIHLILAVVLLQTIGLFHQQPDQRASSNTYHHMLAMMIQRTGLMSRNASWNPVAIEEAPLESMWREWSWHEMTKRALWWSYLHDCCHGIYFGLPMTYGQTEVQLNLPCEDVMWQATSAAEWYRILQNTSSSGTYQTRLTGFNFEKTLSHISEARFLTAHVPLNPFAHFVLVHAILRKLFCVGSEMRKPDGEREREVKGQKIVELQFALHNWLQSWDQSLDKPRTNHNDEPPFISNVLPFYWLGQVAILAQQEGLPPFERDVGNEMVPEARFRLIKHWLKHVRTFLKKGNQDATALWDKLMKIRLQTSQNEEEEGLLDFLTDY